MFFLLKHDVSGEFILSNTCALTDYDTQIGIESYKIFSTSKCKSFLLKLFLQGNNMKIVIVRPTPLIWPQFKINFFNYLYHFLEL